ncbi:MULTISPECIES: Lrp/AsnC family transcriptional regulator [Microbispora]|uniref:Lrp/AsnC family transcriptional regulator n=1 Tax=Microbispora hainanensis TaxID=568844 RepID=A0ABZ1SVH0_9ACTN|nr:MULTISPECIES: Lrp/AsnC family transcriptional regulator [Microbispora]NJP25218.1 Lrp/AsnC family transcriptional regulator [Microbispora sp. CL1-1]
MKSLDDVDRSLLQALARDGRAPVRALARDLALGDSTVSVRLRRLRESGALAAIRVEVDPAALGRPIQALVRVRLRHGVTCGTYERRLREMPAVLSALVLLGDADIEVRVACRNMDDLELAVATLREAGAATTSTQIVTRTVTGLGQALLAEKRTK